MTLTLTPTQVRRVRFATLGLTAPTADSGLSVVRRLGALQGQDLPGVLLSLTTRAPGRTIEEIRAEFSSAALIRAWPMRGTLHVIAPGDLAAFTRLTGERVSRSFGATKRRLGLTQDVLESTAEIVLGELEIRGPMPRSMLREIIVGSGIDPDPPQRINHVIYELAVRGRICLGPFDGTEQLFVSAATWCPADAKPEPDAALRRLLLSYVSGHGPVTDADAARWFGLPLTSIRTAIAELGDALFPVDTPSGPAWMAAGEIADAALSRAGSAAPIRLLPGFDEYMLGYADRGFAVARERLDDIVPGGNGMFRATATVGGRVVGTWSRGGRGTITIAPFERLSAAAMRGFRHEAARIAAATGAGTAGVVTVEE